MESTTCATAFVRISNVFDRFNGGPIEGRETVAEFGQAIGQVGPPRRVEARLELSF